MKNNNYCVKVIGVGGCGCNTVSSLEKKKGAALGECFEFIGIDTDFVNLSRQTVSKKIEIGTGGRGTAKNPDLGAQSAKESLKKIKEAVTDADIVVICAGLGGGTGSGATGPIAQMVRSEFKCPILAVATLPFEHESQKCQQAASEALLKIRETIPVVFPVRSGRTYVGDNPTYLEVWRATDRTTEILLDMISVITNRTGEQNFDFSEFQKLASISGGATIGYGDVPHDSSLAVAVSQAISVCREEPTVSLKKAQSVAYIVLGNLTLSYKEVCEANTNLRNEINHETEILQGTYMSGEEELKRVYVVAVGLDNTPESQPLTVAASNGLEGDQFAMDFLATTSGHFQNCQPTYLENINYDTPTFRRQGLTLLPNL